MLPWIILPYDASPVARAVLRRAGRTVQDRPGEQGGLILAVAGVDPLELGVVLADAQAVAGPDVPLEIRLLAPGNPIGSLQEFADSLPDASLAAPLGVNGKGCAPWYLNACRNGGLSHQLILFYLRPEEISAFEFAEEGHERRRMGGPVGSVLRACARLRLGLRPHVGEAPR
jgi:hypothetical protein